MTTETRGAPGSLIRRNYDRRAQWRARGIPEPTRPEPIVCECCGQPNTVEGRRICLDHDHETGKFRGWLCNQCNVGIGKLGDNIAGILKALAYLRRSN